jgi:hypothetical protein
MQILKLHFLNAIEALKSDVKLWYKNTNKFEFYHIAILEENFYAQLLIFQ